MSYNLSTKGLPARHNRTDLAAPETALPCGIHSHGRRGGSRVDVIHSKAEDHRQIFLKDLQPVE